MTAVRHCVVRTAAMYAPSRPVSFAPVSLHQKEKRFAIGTRFQIVHPIDLLQWPAMVATATAAWFVGSQQRNRRNWGFWLFLVSNVLWILWGWKDHAYALVALQVALAFINIRGAGKNQAG